MAIAATRVTGADYVAGNKKFKVRDLALTGSYATGGEVLTAAAVGLRKVEQVLLHGSASETDLTGAWIAKAVVASNGQSVNIALFESATAGGVFTQKPAEAYESASSVRATFVGH